MTDREHLPETDEYNCLDLLKFICCILVVVIHTEPLKSINEAADYYLTNYAARFAVPFFFITSGFLVFRKTDVSLPDPTVPLKCAGKNFRMYVLWTAIYLPIICYTVSIYEGGTARGILYQICRFFFYGTATQLWYLHSLVAVMLLLALLLRWRTDKRIILSVSVLCYIVGLLTSAYSFLLSRIPRGEYVLSALTRFEEFDCFPHRALNYAFLYITIGMLMSQRRFNISKRKAWVLFTVFSALLLIECTLLYRGGIKNDSGNLLLLPGAAFYLVLACIKTGLPNRAVYKKLRRLSSLIFYIHIFVCRVFAVILEFVGKNNNMLLFIGTLAISWALSELILYLSKKKKLAFLKALYGEYRREKRKEGI